MDGASFVVDSTMVSDPEMAAIYDTIRVRLQRRIWVDGFRLNPLTNGGVIFTRGLIIDAWTAYTCLRNAYRESWDRYYGNLVDYNGGNHTETETLEFIGAVRNSIIEGCKGFSMNYQIVRDVESGAREPLKADPVSSVQGFIWGSPQRWTGCSRQ